MESLLIRADANSQMGSGHLMRCMALGHAWLERGGQVTVVSTAGSLKTRLVREGVEVHYLRAEPGTSKDAIRTASLARRVHADWVLVDGYHFNAEYQRRIKDAGLRLLFIDDHGQCDYYHADIVLNQNLHARESLYPRRDSNTRLLLGPRYVLLRREFLSHRGRERKIPGIARKVLVTFGGADRNNVTLKLMEALPLVDVEGISVMVAVGGWNPHFSQLTAGARRSPLRIRLRRDPSNMPDLMAWADVAVSAAGITTYELAFMGLPSLLVVTSNNQSLMAEQLSAKGVATALGWHYQLSCSEIARAISNLSAEKDTRERMSRAGKELIDGEGVRRVLAHVTTQ